VNELQYRYTLKRENVSDGHYGNLLYIMLNPSTADDEIDDPTIQSCKRLAINNSYCSLCVGNLYAVRSTDPKFLMGLGAQDAKGPENDKALEKMIWMADDIVVAWGKPGGQGTPNIHRLLKGLDLLCIGVNKNGSPKHPLYQRAKTKFKPWSFKNTTGL